MFKEGNILYFTPFFFKNGNTAKPKYFIVLKAIDQENNLLAALPSSVDYVPAKDEIEEGCIELPNINFNCFVFSNKKIVTDCGKKFSLPTYVYGHQIDNYDEAQMLDIYPVEGNDYEVWGKIDSEIFKDLIKCLITSNVVKKKYVKRLKE